MASDHEVPGAGRHRGERERQRAPQPKVGRPSDAEIEQRWRDAVDHWDDPIVLQASPLARLPLIQALAKRSEDAGHGWLAEGRALRMVLRRSLADIEKVMDGSIVGALAGALLQGRTQASVAREQGIREEALSRTYKPRLVTCVRLQAEATSRHVARRQAMEDPGSGTSGTADQEREAS